MALIEIPHPDVSKYEKTALTASAAAAATSLTVENGLSFSVNEWLLIDGYNTSTSEIRRIANSAPTATGITLNASTALQFAHGVGTTLQFIPFNQIDIEYSTDFETDYQAGGVTIAEAEASATWTNLTTINISPENEVTIYNDATTESRSYRVRYYNSQSGVYSSYSDPIFSTGYLENAANKIIRKAVNRMNKTVGKEDDADISVEFLIDEINNCLREVHAQRKRWSWNENYEYVMSEITAGKQDYVLPFDMDYEKSKKNLFNLKVDRTENLEYVDKREFDIRQKDTVNSELAAELNTGSTTATFDDTSDFSDSGEFVVFTGTTKDTVSYDSNNRTTNVLTLSSTTGVTTTHAIDQDVWQDASFGRPAVYTVYEDTVYFDPIPDDDIHQRTIEIDYYKKMVEIDSDHDLVLFPDPMLVVDYLCMAIAEKMRSYEDIERYERRYKERLNLLVRNEVTGQDKKWTLDLNTGGYPTKHRVILTTRD